MKKNNNIKVITISIIMLVILTFIILYFLVFKKSMKLDIVRETADKNPTNDSYNEEENNPLELNDYKIIRGEEYNINSFIKSYSKNYSLRFENEEMANFTEPGIYDIRIIGISDNGDRVIKSAILRILDAKDFNYNQNSEDISNQEEKKNDNHDEEKNGLLNETDNNSSNNNLKNNTTITTKVNVSTTTKSSTPIKINNITETSETISYNYGVVIKKTSYLNYDIYDNGNKILVDSHDDYSYDYSTFNATTNELKDEASIFVNQNSESINAVLGYVNQYRSEVGLSPLILDDSLNLAASIRALEMGWSRKFDHTRPNGTMCFSVIDELGIGYYVVGENIASGYTDAASVSNGWKNSPGHYANMISSDFGKIGVGLANINGTYYWVQLFTN